MEKMKIIDSKLLELLVDLENTYRGAKFRLNMASIAADEFRHKKNIQERYGKARRHFRNVCIAVDETLQKVEIQEHHKTILPTLYRVQNEGKK